MLDVAPQALEAEEEVLGAMLLSANAAEKAASALTQEMFFRESHGIIFDCMKKMLDDGVPTDPITVHAALEEQGHEISRVRLYELAGLVPATANILHYARLVAKAWQRRSVLTAIQKISQDIDILEDPIATLEQAALELEQKVADRHELVVDMKDLIEAKKHQMEHPESVKPGIPAPFSFLPELVGGRLYVLSGVMKDGKSRAMIQFAEAAARAGEKVGIASAEMSKADLFDAWACQRTGIPHWKVSKPHLLNPLEQKRLLEAMEEMEPWKVKVIDDEAIDPAKLRRYQRAGKYDILFIDHLHQMSWRDRQHLDEGVKAITRIAREFEIPVVLLAQLNRSTDQSNPYPVPTMSRLKESSTIEALASVVWFVYRERDDHHLQTSRAQFITAANRYGRVGVETMYFDDVSQSFKETDWVAVEAEESKDDFPF